MLSVDPTASGIVIASLVDPAWWKMEMSLQHVKNNNGT